MRPFRRLWLFAATAAMLTLAPVAGAQEYATETGDLDLEIDVLVTVTISGDGYVPDSVVYVTLVGQGDEGPIDLGTLTTDDQGRFFGEVTIPADVHDGEYTVAATGVTSQGATRVLSTQIQIGQKLTVVEPSVSTTTVAETVAQPSVVSSRPDRGSGLDPIETSDPPPSETDNPLDRILVRALLGGLVVLSGVWWWLYRVVKR